MNRQFRILLVEDDSSDALLALMVNEVNLTGEALHVADGVLALDYLHARGAFAARAPGLPAWCCSISSCPGWMVSRCCNTSEPRPPAARAVG